MSTFSATFETGAKETMRSFTQTDSPAPTFMDLWGHIALWMPLVIGLECLVAFQTLPTSLALWLVPGLMLLEAVQFSWHVFIHHDDHPLAWILLKEEHAILSGNMNSAYVFPYSVAILIVYLLSVTAWATTSGPVTFAIITSLHVGQISASWTIHQIAHGTTIFHRGTHKDSEFEITMYTIGIVSYAILACDAL